jgi:hypothetical protein
MESAQVGSNIGLSICTSLCEATCVNSDAEKCVSETAGRLHIEHLFDIDKFKFLYFDGFYGFKNIS